MVVVNEAGWEIPGLRNARVKPGTLPSSKNKIGDFTYEVTVLVPGRNQVFQSLPQVYLDQEANQLVYKVVDLKILEIQRFEMDKKPYCYKISALVRSADPHSKVSGWAGTLELLFFNETPSGTWTVLDQDAPVLPDVPRPFWTRVK
jgi:hypothetical protein